MKIWFTIPNILSYLRVILMCFAFWNFLQDSNKILFLILTIVVVAMDGLDGIVARKFNQATPLGAKVDIFCDRLTELGYWYFFGYLGIIGFWVFWFFLIRGLAVDFLTRKSSKPLGDSWLRSGRFMRASYGTLKILSFGLLIICPFYELLGLNLASLITWLTVLICFLRAVPVFMMQFVK
ncbi:MAG: hypothetical protein RLZZ361_558 [Cyanobacteriota bacterium]|jgi:CDP-diacylglycerol--glycerol-3-phosphate 3-phosphatidyltransferase